MPWIVYVGSGQQPPEPALKLRTKEDALRWAARLRARAEVKRLPQVEIFVRCEDED